MFIPFLSYVLNSACVHAKSGFPGGTSGKEPTHQGRRHKRCRFDPWVRKIPWRRAWQPTLVGHNWKQLSLNAHIYRSWFVAYKTKFFIVVSGCATLWTAACQAPLSMGFSRQESWSGLPFPPPGDLPNPGVEPHLLCLLHWQAGSLPLAPPGRVVLNTTTHETKITFFFFCCTVHHMGS